MLRIENLKLSPGGGSSALRNAILHILRIPEKDLLALHILRRLNLHGVDHVDALPGVDAAAEDLQGPQVFCRAPQDAGGLPG